MAVELGRTWRVRHGQLRFARRFLGNSGSTALLNRDARARRQAPLQDILRQSLIAPEGGWIRRQRRRETERRRAGKRRIELTLREILCASDQNRTCEELFCFWDAGEGEPTGREWQRNHVRRSGSIGLRRMRRPWRTAAGRHAETHD